MNKSNNLDNFFSYVSKAVIIIPIFIFIFALIFKFGQTKTETGRINPTGFINETPTTIPVINKIPIDLIGPWICHYQDGQKQYDLFINNRKVILQVKENGQIKKQDFSSYIPYVESFLNADISTLENMINKYTGKKINLREILESCKKES